jgi:hypothetical protein
MSGGFFDYNQYKIGQIADDVEQLIINNSVISTDEYGFTRGYTYSDETIAEFKKGLYMLQQAQIYAQRIDYLVSGDDGEDSFHSRLKADLGENNGRTS